MPIREYLDKVVRKPLKMTSFQFGVSPERVADVARDTFTGPSAFFPLSIAVRKAFGGPMHEAVALAGDPRFLTAVVPSGNLICTANEASLFFECLLRGGKVHNRRVFGERTVKRAILEQSYHEHDAVLQYPFRFGMGFMLGSDRSSVLGPDTPEAFGHMGFTNILIYADPERDISVALLNNGKPFIAVESLWWLNIARTITQTIPKT
jgi:CubicO group peptidase (beta-lactamase class C family)